MIRAPGSYAGLTVKQAELLSFIRYQAAKGKTPSYDEMGQALHIASKSGVARLVYALEERGYVQRLHNRARAITPVDAPRPLDNRLHDATIRQLLDELALRGLAVSVAGGSARA